jgi:nicotinate-nucleotide adenylyltransferase
MSKKDKQKIGIFGGSFDPIHYGHLILAEQMRELAGLDKIIFIPARVSPFKTASAPISGLDRYEMVKLAVAGEPAFEVSDIEITSEEVSYTSNTMRRLSEQYGDSAKLYFILGSDSILKLDKWHEADYLLKNFSFLAGLRKGYNADEAIAKRDEIVSNFGADLRLCDIPELEISSSDLRLRLQGGKSLKYVIPDPVLDYIREKKLYTGLIDELKAFARERENDHRYKHTEGVVKAAKEYAKRYGADVFKAEVAAWFHDTYKEAGPLGHGPKAAEEIQKQFGINDPDIVNAIKYHTTSRPGMSTLEMVVKMADLLEENRNYPDVEKLRKAMTDDLDESMLLLLREEQKILIGRGQPYDPLTDEAVAWLEMIHERKING